MHVDRKYAFHWGLLGDIELGRPNLGQTMRLEQYRLMQFTFRDRIEASFGTAEADRIFYEAGQLSGSFFYEHFLAGCTSLEQFISRLETILHDLGIGILRLEKADLISGHFILCISEDLDCSGLPELDFEVCKYDEGFLAALLEGFTRHPYRVQEVDCWCTGDRTCRFDAKMIPSA